MALSVFVVLLIVVSVNSITGNAVRNSGDIPGGNTRTGNFLCRFSPDFCNCAPSRVCLDSNTVRTRTQQCVVNTYDCAAGQLCQYGNCYMPTPPDSCTDSDGGIHLSLKGTASVVFSDENGTMYGNYTDYCQSNNMLREYYCNGNYLANQQNVVCPNGCLDGACLSQNLNLSDLIVSSLNVIVVNSTKVITYATVKNIGNSNAGSFMTRFLLSGPVNNTQYKNIIALSSGQSAVLSVNYTVYPSTPYLLYVNADWFNNVTETHENNNQNSTYFNT